jgi:thiol-disulfide isomerase/thioredoxin
MAWLGLVVLLLGCSQSEPLSDNLTSGQPMPAFVLQGLNGEQSSLDAYRGKLVVLNVWATWCEPCRREMPNLQQLSDTLDPQRFVVLGLAEDDDPHVVREYLLDKQIGFVSFIDPGREISTELLGIQIFPYTLLIAPDGSFVQRFPGPREWHREEVVKLLEKAYNGDYSDLLD